MKKLFEGFSWKECRESCYHMIKTISFLVMIYFLFGSLAMHLLIDAIDVLGNSSEGLIQLGDSMEEEIDTYVQESKAKYGEDYPAEGMAFFKVSQLGITENIFYGCIFTIVAGIILGTLKYLIVVRKAKGVQMLAETTILGIGLVVSGVIIDYAYNAWLTNAVKEFNVYPNTVNAIFGFDLVEVVVAFVSIVAIAFIVNVLYQKYLCKKMNEKLTENKA